MDAGAVRQPLLGIGRRRAGEPEADRLVGHSFKPVVVDQGEVRPQLNLQFQSQQRQQEQSSKNELKSFYLAKYWDRLRNKTQKNGPRREEYSPRADTVKHEQEECFGACKPQ